MSYAVLLDVKSFSRFYIWNDRPFIIGSSTRANYTIYHLKVSPELYLITYDGKHWTGSNLSGNNVILTNGEILRQKHVLKSNDLLTIAGSNAILLQFYENAVDVPRNRSSELEEGTFNIIRRLCAENTRLSRELAKLKQETSTLISSLTKKVEMYENFQNKIEMQLRNSIEEELSCCICIEVVFDAVILSCGHIICNYCLQRWKKMNRVCPLCRAEVTNEVSAARIDTFIDSAKTLLGVSFTERRKELRVERGAATS